MPVAIKDLIVRAVATAVRTEAPDDAPTRDGQQALIEACVRKVLKILKQSSER